MPPLMKYSTLISINLSVNNPKVSYILFNDEVRHHDGIDMIIDMTVIHSSSKDIGLKDIIPLHFVYCYPIFPGCECLY